MPATNVRQGHIETCLTCVVEGISRDAIIEAIVAPETHAYARPPRCPRRPSMRPTNCPSGMRLVYIRQRRQHNLPRTLLRLNEVTVRSTQSIKSIDRQLLLLQLQLSAPGCGALVAAALHTAGSGCRGVPGCLDRTHCHRQSTVDRGWCSRSEQTRILPRSSFADSEQQL